MQREQPENKGGWPDTQTADDETLLKAAKSCPTKAIVPEADDGRQVYP